jgi:hypothetical protein
MVFQVMLILFLNAFLKYKLVEWLESADPWLSGWKPKVWHLLVLQMALLKILCFERSYFLQGENLRSCIGQRRHLWTVSLHGGVSFREPFCIQVLFLAVVYGLLLRGVDCYGAFYFLFLFLHVLCILMSLWHLLVQRLAGIGIFSILIYFLLK